MSISRASWLTFPQGDDKISQGIFGYLTARVRQRAYDVVIREFKRSGLSKAALARRWDKDPAVVTRFLARPGNWEIDTYTEALFAISGSIPNVGADHLFNDVGAIRADFKDKSGSSTNNLTRLPPPRPMAA